MRTVLFLAVAAAMLVLNSAGPATGVAEARRVPAPPPVAFKRTRPSPAPAEPVFGPLMRHALIRFQLAYGLSGTGRVDAATSAALELPYTGPLGPGARDGRVAAVKSALIEKAFWPEAATPLDAAITADRPLIRRPIRARLGPVPPPAPRRAQLDGAYGAFTAAAVAAFQHHVGLAPTGTADAATLAALRLKGLGPLGRGARGAKVRRLQQALLTRGFWRAR